MSDTIGEVKEIDLYGNKIHFLKTWTAYYDDVVKGVKPWELRLNDRKYKQGDHLVLMRYDIEGKRYTGKMSEYKVIYIFHGNQFGIVDGWCLMTLVPTNLPQRAIEIMIEKENNKQKGINPNF